MVRSAQFYPKAVDEISQELENMEYLAPDATGVSVDQSFEEESVLRQLFNSCVVPQLDRYSVFDECDKDVEVKKMDNNAGTEIHHVYDGKVCKELSSETKVGEEGTGRKDVPNLVQDDCPKIASEAIDLPSNANGAENKNLDEIIGGEIGKYDEETVEIASKYDRDVVKERELQNLCVDNLVVNKKELPFYTELNSETCQLKQVEEVAIGKDVKLQQETHNITDQVEDKQTEESALLLSLASIQTLSDDCNVDGQIDSQFSSQMNEGCDSLTYSVSDDILSDEEDLLNINADIQFDSQDSSHKTEGCVKVLGFAPGDIVIVEDSVTDHDQFYSHDSSVTIPSTEHVNIVTDESSEDVDLTFSTNEDDLADFSFEDIEEDSNMDIVKDASGDNENSLEANYNGKKKYNPHCLDIPQPIVLTDEMSECEVVVRNVKSENHSGSRSLKDLVAR